MKGRIYIAGVGLFILVVLGMFLSSCSSWRVREKYSTREHVERHQLEIDSVEMKWNVNRQRLQFSKAGQQIVIWPKGEFRFDLDSGYRGEAVVVEVSRKVMDSVVEQEVTLEQLALHTQVQEYEEKSLDEEFEFSEGENKILSKWECFISVGFVLLGFYMLCRFY